MLIKVRCKDDKFYTMFTFMDKGKERNFRYFLKSESKLRKLNSIVCKDSLLSDMWEDERLFLRSEITRQELIHLITNLDKFKDMGFEVIIPKIICTDSKMTISTTKKGRKISSSISVNGNLIDLSHIKKAISDLCFINGQWQIVDTKIARQILENELSFVEIIKVCQSKKEYIKSKDIHFINTVNGGDLSGHLSGFKATLYDYQKTGFKMLSGALKSNMNMLLADDMGLGKTMQIVALLNSLKYDNKSPNLLIVPKTLIGNFVSHIEKFSPNIKYQVIDKEIDLSNDVFITTYGKVLHNQDMFMEVMWNLIVLDEAQNIKNPDSSIAVAVCGLHSNHRIAMTGTPIENSIADLWALFKFLEPTLLGTLAEFKKTIKNKYSYDWLIQLIKPFFIRRMKNKDTVNLPDKLEKLVYCEMTDCQTDTYNAVLEMFNDELNQSNKYNRPTILKYINTLKLVCDSSEALFNGRGTETSSGKFKELKRLIKHHKKSKIIIFTQYLKVAEMLNEFLSNHYKRDGLLINGKKSAKERSRIADEFQAGDFPYMILTLKSGGTGLTLTESNVVIHFDRWWNPSIENQATDRAYRIGQTNNVHVYKFISKGTLEERINSILECKSELFNHVVNPMNMSKDEILNFVKLN